MPEKTLTECRCGCGFDTKDRRVIALVEELTRRSFRVGSVCRCAARNREAGGVPNSQHLRGLAVDVEKPLHDVNTMALLRLLVEHAPTFAKHEPYGIHVDFR